LHQHYSFHRRTAYNHILSKLDPELICGLDIEDLIEEVLKLDHNEIKEGFELDLGSKIPLSKTSKRFKETDILGDLFMKHLMDENGEINREYHNSETHDLYQKAELSSKDFKEHIRDKCEILRHRVKKQDHIDSLV
jgi:hypothetical protein